MFRIALASPPLVGSIHGALAWVERFVSEAAVANAQVVCFPESFIPGYRGEEFEVDAHDPEGLRAARDRVCALAAQHELGIIIPMDWDCPEGIHNVAFGVSERGELLGCQTKAQLGPSEDATFVPGSSRQVFEIYGVRFGVAICIEGWRYPETVRWAAVRGAQVVFHPNLAGSNRAGQKVESWGAQDSPYYEKAMVCRSVENSIYFASVNYALRFQEAATAVIGPDGSCIDHLAYGEPGLLVVEIDPAKATRLHAARFAPDRY